MTPGGNPRRARVERCQRCGGFTWRGLDADLIAGTAVTDVAPLDPFGELVALTAGLLTYDLQWLGGRYELAYRELHVIQSHPPGIGPNRDVVSEHRCGIDIAHRAPSTLAQLRKPERKNAKPPF